MSDHFLPLKATTGVGRFTQRVDRTDIIEKDSVMSYVEYATSSGPGTLIEHGVILSAFTLQADIGSISQYSGPATTHIAERITPERYQEFISIHGSERAV